MRKSRALIFTALISASTLLLGGCSQGPTTTPTETNQAEAGTALTIWVDAELGDLAQTLADQYNQDTGGTLTVVEKDFFQIETDLSGGAPDLFIGSTEWTDRLAADGALAELGSPEIAGFENRVLQGASHQGVLYGIPYAIESLALICNAEEIQQQPSSLQELTDAGLDLIVNSGGDPYTLFPIQSSFEVYPLELDENLDWVESTGLGSARSEEFVSWLSENKSSFKQLDYSAGIQAFIEGEESCLLTGPWSISELLNRVDFQLAVYDFPSVGGAQPLSFSTARTIYVSATSKNQEQAKKVANYFSNSATQLLIYKQTGRVPAKADVIGDLEDKVVAGFAKAAAWSVPLPTSNLMQNTWAPWSRALNDILSNDGDALIIWDLMVQELAKGDS